MDLRNSSIERSGYLMKAKINDLVQALRGTSLGFPWMIERYQKG